MGNMFSDCCDCDCWSVRKNVTVKDVITDIKMLTHEEIDNIKSKIHDPWLFPGKREQRCFGCC